MSREAEFIASLRALAGAGARNLMDDAAVLDLGGRAVVVTKDLLVEGVHYLRDDPPEDVAWKLVAVNLSDLAAKGARPLGVLLGYQLGEGAWDGRFAEGLRRCLAAFDVALLGGDTVSSPPGGPRTLSMTALGEAAGPVPARAGANPGDQLWVSGSIGDAGAGLGVLRGELDGDEALVRRYRAPRPRLEAGQRLAACVSAMMDVSDGLLIDAGRMAAASGLAVRIEIDAVPLSQAYLDALGDGREARLRAATAGDDYELLFAAPGSAAVEILRLSEALGLPLSRIGQFESGAGLSLVHEGAAVPHPERLGFEHDAAQQTQP